MDLKTELTRRLDEALGKYLQAEGADRPEGLAAGIEVPRNREHGDYATNVAMQLARLVKRSPRQVAQEFLTHFDGAGLVGETSIDGPGFINFRLAADATAAVLRRIVSEGAEFGKSRRGAGTRVLVEFVSANPTGPLHIGHARNAVVGDTVARLYEAVGYDVSREYYYNNAGVQMRVLGTTLRLRVDELVGRPVEWPESYYRGSYMIDIARRLIDEVGADQAVDRDDDFYTKYAAGEIIKTIEADLEAMDIGFDNWFLESGIYERGEVERTLDEMRARGAIYEEDGAVWFRATQFGDTRDRVVVKGDGTYTYLTPDIAYNQDKYGRGYDEVVTVLGADHHGQVPSLLAAAEALGHPKETLHYVIYQMVTLLKDGVALKLSTRSGEFITFKEMIDELGAGVVRYFFSMRSPDAQMTFDWGLAKDTSMDNPVYYVQYAHARCCSLMKKAQEEGCPYGGIDAADGTSRADLALLALPAEQAILRALGRLPEAIDTAARELAPHQVCNYLQEVAQLFHNFFTQGNNDPSLRIIQTDKPALTQARLAMIDALRTVLANALAVLGIEAMDRM
ncbi:arginine--tRNA ligase [Candidatus Sumerlaeota bacterium]|nr:arginine--tRNA ligase [Candidatus Sumerlaeota bacterium]